MHHAIKAVGAEKGFQRGLVCQVAQHELSTQHRIAVACREIVVGDDIATLAEQVLDHVGADITRAAHDKDADWERWRGRGVGRRLHGQVL